MCKLQIQVLLAFGPCFLLFFLKWLLLICRYKALGIRLDSGDLSYFSMEARRIFQAIEKEFNVPGFGNLVITASNDINEETLDALNKQVLTELDPFLAFTIELELRAWSSITGTALSLGMYFISV